MIGDTAPLANGSTTPAPLAPHDPEAIAAVQTQLTNYSQQLSDLYTQRASMVGAREAARLQYVTGWMYSVAQTFSAISSQMVNDKATLNLITVINAIYSLIIGRIPMVTVSGNNASGGWSAYFQSGSVPGGVFFYGYGVSASILSPIEVLISNTNSQGQTVYQILNSAGNSTNSWSPTSPGSPVYSIASMFPPPASPTDSATTISIPISKSFANYFINSQYGQSYLMSDSDYAYMNSLFNKDFGNGSLNTLFENGYALFMDLVNQTLDIFTFQGQIQALESQIQNFITEYQSYGLINQAMPISDVEASLFQIANTQNAQAALSVAQQSVLPASSAAVPPAPTTPSVPSSTSQSSAQSTSLTGLSMKAMGDTVSFLSSPNSVWYALGALAFVVLLKSGKKKSGSRGDEEYEEDEELAPTKAEAVAASSQPETKTNPRRRRRKKRKTKK